MGTTKPNVEYYAPQVYKIERRITVAASLLTMAGRSTLVDVDIFSVPIYTMCSVKVHDTNLKSIDRVIRHGMWRGSDKDGKGKLLVAWSKVTTPKDKGGLGLKNLRMVNEALLVKYLHKLYNKDVP
jgi:hypothetical protein